MITNQLQIGDVFLYRDKLVYVDEIYSAGHVVVYEPLNKKTFSVHQSQLIPILFDPMADLYVEEIVPGCWVTTTGEIKVGIMKDPDSDNWLAFAPYGKNTMTDFRTFKYSHELLQFERYVNRIISW